MPRWGEEEKEIQLALSDWGRKTKEVVYGSNGAKKHRQMIANTWFRLHPRKLYNGLFMKIGGHQMSLAGKR